MAEARIAFIGGSGLYQIDGLTATDELELQTPFGAPSDRVTLGTLEGERVAFLPRHGRGHRFSPTSIPVRANIYALKGLGVERIVSISAVGSLREGIKPLEMIVPDQIIDRTRSRANTFFESGMVAHVGFADPFCPEVRRVLTQSAQDATIPVHEAGTYVVMEGPQFSTRAESELYRSWGASIIGMTALPEAKLAREAEICYATLALVTDYDVWHQTEEEVSIDLVVANLMRNVESSHEVLRRVVRALPETRQCPCATALKDAIITSPEHIDDGTRRRLSAIVRKYLEVKEPLTL